MITHEGGILVTLILPVSKLRLRGFKLFHPRPIYELIETVLNSVMEKKQINYPNKEI